jgi:site-specific DNA-methyltransferase (adenine-specific)
VRKFKFDKGVLVNADCLDVLRHVRENSVDLIFADPPFNVGYKYDRYDDRRDPDEYLSWCEKWIAACWQCLRPSGSIFVAIGDEFAGHFKVILDTFFDPRNWIVWHYTFGVYCDTKFGRGHAHVFYHTKGKKGFTWNPDEIREPSARQLKYNDKRANPKGRVPCDVWNFPRVCGTFKERTGHPCQMPESLLERIVKVSSNPNDVVLDPFAGSGTTLAVANKLGRRFIGCEISDAYARSAAIRIRRGR